MMDKHSTLSLNQMIQRVKYQRRRSYQNCKIVQGKGEGNKESETTANTKGKRWQGGTVEEVIRIRIIVKKNPDDSSHDNNNSKSYGPIRVFQDHSFFSFWLIDDNEENLDDYTLTDA